MSTVIAERTDKLAEGKTKIIWASGDQYEVLIESKDDITAGDGAKHDTLEGKAVAATTTTCNVFELINRAGHVPTHFLTQVDERTFRARACHMIPIEVVARRIAYGSYLKRNPEVTKGTMFRHLVLEMFHKNDAAHDPFMVYNEAERSFNLYDAKQPVGPTTLQGVMPATDLDPNHVTLMRLGAAAVFLQLEKALSDQHIQLVDLKVEFGFDKETGQLRLADVVDNDSWRIWPYGQEHEMLDKQVYRDLNASDEEARAAAMAKIGGNYREVAVLSGRMLGCGQGCGCRN
jgi:phosphoribosylaminoimidazole-succinocarboxamide synthase